MTRKPARFLSPYNHNLGLSMIDWDKCAGLVPVIVQDATTKEVLMQAYADKEALRLTFETGYAHYFSRSRQSLWKKGETSGNVQKVVSVFTDCDEDCILYLVDQTGAACHTGSRSCFFNKKSNYEDC